MKAAICLLTVTIAAGGIFKSCTSWWNEPADAGVGGAISTPGGGTYTPPPAPTGPVAVPVAGGGEIVVTPPAPPPVVTKGDVLAQTGIGIISAAFPAAGVLASMIVGLLNAKKAKGAEA